MHRHFAFYLGWLGVEFGNGNWDGEFNIFNDWEMIDMRLLHIWGIACGDGVEMIRKML